MEVLPGMSNHSVRDYSNLREAFQRGRPLCRHFTPVRPRVEVRRGFVDDDSFTLLSMPTEFDEEIVHRLNEDIRTVPTGDVREDDEVVPVDAGEVRQEEHRVTLPGVRVPRAGDGRERAVVFER